MEVVQTVAGVMSSLVAVVALLVAFRVELRSNTRFQAQLEQSERIARANVRPLVTIYSQAYTDLKSVKLVNRGIGTAVINAIEFSKNGRSTRNLVELFEIDREFSWQDFRRYPEGLVYLPPGETVDLVKISETHLINQNISPHNVEDILKQWQAQKTGIEVRIEYEDVLGNPQDPYVDTLN